MVSLNFPNSEIGCTFSLIAFGFSSAAHRLSLLVVALEPESSALCVLYPSAIPLRYTLALDCTLNVKWEDFVHTPQCLLFWKIWKSWLRWLSIGSLVSAISLERASSPHCYPSVFSHLAPVGTFYVFLCIALYFYLVSFFFCLKDFAFFFLILDSFYCYVFQVYQYFF